VAFADLSARLRASGAVLGVLAAGGLAALSVAGLVVAEGRLAGIDRAGGVASSRPTGTSAAVGQDVAAAVPAGSRADALLAAMNADRVADGAGALAADDRLTRAAQRWAQRMAAARSLSHQPLDAVLDLGFATAGETILSGPPGLDPTAVQRAWMASPPNRSTLLSRAFTATGVGFATDDEDRVWVAVILAG
jgi:uncharacterized protein YkwD